MQLEEPYPLLTCAHPLGKPFHALFACHYHRCCKQRYSSAHYAFGCRLETRAQSCLGILRLPAQDPSRLNVKHKKMPRKHCLFCLVYTTLALSATRANRNCLRVNLKLNTSLKDICASAASPEDCKLP